MTGALTGRTAIVTGASQGIGEAVAWLFAEQGARLVLSETDDAAQPVAAAIVQRHPESLEEQLGGGGPGDGDPDGDGPGGPPLSEDSKEPRHRFRARRGEPARDPKLYDFD